MKATIVSAAILLPTVLFAQEKKKAAPAGSPFTIQGTVSEQQKPATVYLRMRKGGETVLDSAQLSNGKFTITGNVEEPSLVSLMLVQKSKEKLMSMGRDMLALYVDNGTITVTTTDSISKATVTGSKANDDYMKLQEQLKDVNAQAAALQKKYREMAKNKDEEGLKKLETAYDALDAEEKKIEREFLLQNTSSPIAMYVLNQVAGYDIKPNEILPLYKKLSKAARNSPSGKDLGKRLESAKKTAVGESALEFSQADSSGANISLASFRGKYVLVDFWASWCGPCRAENPNVVKAYDKFKSKGFEILGVSLDDKKEKWLAAITADKLTWTHVSDLKGWKNTVAELYGVRAIPQNVLIDPKGKIIAKNLRGEELEKKLAEVL
ncbi:MAG TPA: TlpA disulfide reductase family protein [Chitinophaga sp.]|uniref:TlpA disulfide reductase family protein n=1 Tax=Chitinophaga sp. TaxID=1869181 RepID=UPI002B765A8E|nr:TlpA disulfide reductase family protein [Chitinophaga sp.]HVI47569.1 TlpA disulfide reductase family protein [Chitinophaga sp.]